MIYREYGQTGKKISLLGFGGMRFKNIDDHDECVRMMIAAAKGGINYYDTAPGYFRQKSELVFGDAFKEMRKQGLPYFSATKTMESTESRIRAEIEGQLKRLDVDAIDFYHIWCIYDMGNWEERKKNNVIQTFVKLKEEGLIKHICVSSHVVRDEVQELLSENVFEGVLFGYSAYNFKITQYAFDVIREKKLGAVVMNPLGGGVIPQHPLLFKFLCREDESATTAALRFLWDHPDITSTLVGFDTMEHLNDALSAIDGYKPRTSEELEQIKIAAPDSFTGICTGCGYCITDNKCPVDIPIPFFMDAYNMRILNKEDKDPVADRLKWHWRIEKSLTEKCISCGKCEEACTQHLDIIKRLKEL